MDTLVCYWGNNSNNNYDNMSVNQKKREEMHKHIRVLELKKELENTRQELFKLRKMNYAAKS